jgi:hypothetical protein
MTVRVPWAGNEVPKDLAHEPLSLGPDAVHRGLGLVRESALDAGHLVARLAGEELSLAVPPLPQPRHEERHERQGPSLSLRRSQNLLHDRVVLEPIAFSRRRLHHRSAKRVPWRRAERGQPIEDRCQRLMVVAAHEEVVPQRQQHVDVRFRGEASQERREALLRVRLVQREQLLELIDDEQRGLVCLPPPAHDF